MAYEQKKYLWYNHTNTDRALKKQLQESIDAIYLDSFWEELVGITNKYTHDAIKLMHKEYGKIYGMDTNKNNAPMMTPYDM